MKSLCYCAGLVLFLLLGCAKRIPLDDETIESVSEPESESASSTRARPETKRLQSKLRTLREEKMEPEREGGEDGGEESREIFDNAEVIGYLDNPTPVYIIDGDAKATRKLTGASASSVKAGLHDDNEEFAFYRDFCAAHARLPIPYDWDVSERCVFKVMHADSSAAFNQEVAVVDKSGSVVLRARTQASGEVVVFPGMDLGEQYSGISDYSIAVGDGKRIPLCRGVADQVEILIDEARRLPERIPVQVCFLMDATGSMKDEIQQLRDVIFSIHSRILRLPSKPSVAFSIVAYRDRKDAFLVKGYPFTANIDTFQLALESIKAGGGGDYPEDIESGLVYCIDSLSWAEESVKFIFLVADAPPHLREKPQNYHWAARRCREQGIMISPVGASGLTLAGEYVFRQMALLTNGKFVFLHYGEQGESDGAGTDGDPGKVSHHTGDNYNVRRLDDIVVDIVAEELGYLTQRELITHDFPEPKTQSRLLETRMVSLLRQVLARNPSRKGTALVLPPIAASDPSLGQLSKYLWELALEKLPSLTKASVLERTRLEEVLKEQAISLSGMTEPTDESRIGKLLNADYLLLSRLHYLGALRVCHMRMVECESGRVVGAARVKL